MSHTISQVSDGGVHSHIRHLKALLETAKEQGVPHTYIHFFGDGRDTAPRSARGYVKDLLEFLETESYGTLATVVGRYYAMDRDKRWERIEIALKALIGGVGEETDDVLKTIDERYAKNETDEFFKPIIVSSEGRIGANDTLFFFNYRSDRMREIVTVLGSVDDDKPVKIEIPKDLVRPHYSASIVPC